MLGSLFINEHKWAINTPAYLHLAIGPARDFHHHVQHGLLGVGKQGYIMEGGYNSAIGTTCKIHSAVMYIFHSIIS